MAGTPKPTPTPRRKERPLTERQLRFIAEYLVTLNGAASARKAGYSDQAEGAKVAAAKLMANPKVRQRLAARAKDKLEQLDLRAEKVLLAIDRALDADVRDLFDWHGHVRPLDTLTARQAYLITSFEVILKNAKAGDGVTDEVLKVKLEPRAQYVEMAAKYFGLLVDCVEVNASEDIIEILKAARLRVSEAKRATKALPMVDVKKGQKE